MMYYLIDPLITEEAMHFIYFDKKDVYGGLKSKNSIESCQINIAISATTKSREFR